MTEAVVAPILPPKPALATVPRDVYLAIEREAAHEPSDPFLVRRLLAHYRQGIWGPADMRVK
jgi:hypothetical protein